MWVTSWSRNVSWLSQECPQQFLWIHSKHHTGHFGLWFPTTKEEMREHEKTPASTSLYNRLCSLSLVVETQLIFAHSSLCVAQTDVVHMSMRVHVCLCPGTVRVEVELAGSIVLRCLCNSLLYLAQLGGSFSVHTLGHLVIVTHWTGTSASEPSCVSHSPWRTGCTTWPLPSPCSWWSCC